MSHTFGTQHSPAGFLNTTLTSAPPPPREHRKKFPNNLEKWSNTILLVIKKKVAVQLINGV